MVVWVGVWAEEGQPGQAAAPVGKETQSGGVSKGVGVCQVVRWCAQQECSLEAIVHVSMRIGRRETQQSSQRAGKVGRPALPDTSTGRSSAAQTASQGNDDYRLSHLVDLLPQLVGDLRLLGLQQLQQERINSSRRVNWVDAIGPDRQSGNQGQLLRLLGLERQTATELALAGKAGKDASGWQGWQGSMQRWSQ